MYISKVSIDTTNKFSFKAVGNLWRKRLKLLVVDREEVYYVHNITSNETVNSNENESNSTSQRRSISTKTTSLQSTLSLKNSSIESPSNLTKIISNNLSVFSSFNCFMDFPSSIAEYLNYTFKSQFELGHVDLYEKDINDDVEKLPILLDVRATCSVDGECKTYFEFDKQYGLQTNYEGNMALDNMFYCCALDLTNTTNELCKQAKPLVKKSILRESKNPVLLVSSTLTFFKFWCYKYIVRVKICHIFPSGSKQHR